LFILNQILVLSLSLNWSAGATGPDELERFEPKILDISIPGGMTAEEDTQILVKYELKKSCDQIARSSVMRHDEHRQVLQIVSEAIRDPKISCQPQARTEVVKINLGALEVGRYEFRNYHRLRQRLGELRVFRRSSDPKLGGELAYSVNTYLTKK
jgi:hypothetical protein